MDTNSIISLQGHWYCNLDWNDCGIEEMWFNSEIHDTIITLPGTTASNGIGEPLDMQIERIDNRDIQNINTTPSTYTDETQTIWNGIIGNLELVAADKISITNIDIYPDIYKKSAIVKVYIDNLLNKDTDILVRAAVYQVGNISNLSFKDIKEAAELEIRLTIEDTIGIYKAARAVEATFAA